jgi:hypothetical protein
MPICSEGTYQWLPGIVDDGSGGAIIAWQDSRSGSESADIYAQRINADGVVKWITDGVPISIASHQQILLNIVGDGSGGAIIVWQDFRNNTNYDIYAQRINATGDAQWTLDGVAISIANYHQANPTLTSDGTDGAIVAWQDSRGGTGQDIYAQIVRGDGSLGGKTAGTISGKVRVGTYGLQNVIVKLLDQDGNPLQDFLPITTNISGEYAFAEVPGAQEYQVLIVEPLGYTVDQNPKVITLLPGGNMLVDFILTQSVVANNARGLGYWKHQFDVYVTNQGNAQETQQSLTDYIIGVHEHYTPHFSLFDGLMTFAEWHDILTMRNSAPMLERARGHVATLVLNLASLKIGQYTTVTLDGKTAGDVLTYSSILLTDTDPSNDQLAKNLAEKVNNHAQIESGIVPSGSVLYKGSWAENVNQTFDASHDFSLYDNYPNPFNPVTNFRIKIPHKSFVKLEIFNSLGQQLSTIIDEEKEAGNYEVSWNASGLTSGVYFYKLTSGTFSETKKLILLK